MSKGYPSVKYINVLHHVYCTLMCLY